MAAASGAAEKARAAAEAAADAFHFYQHCNCLLSLLYFPLLFLVL